MSRAGACRCICRPAANARCHAPKKTKHAAHASRAASVGCSEYTKLKMQRRRYHADHFMYSMHMDLDCKLQEYGLYIGAQTPPTLPPLNGKRSGLKIFPPSGKGRLNFPKCSGQVIRILTKLDETQ